MYGVVEVSGHQYRVNVGTIFDVELQASEEGTLVDLDQVLFIGGENPTVGFPTVKGAMIKAKVIRHDRGKKILMVRKQPGKWSKKKGHRQDFTTLLVTEIHDGNGKVVKIDNESKEAKKFLAE